MTPTFFSDRIEGITAQQSADLLAGLQRITPPLVDAEGWLAADPKTFDVSAGVGAGAGGIR